MTRINTNVSSLVAQNTLGRSNAALEQALTRLSTGLRINTGKDDPAGLIASENLRSDITSIKRAIGNTDRANQVIATSDSALGQVSSLLNDIRGLVVEAANAGALSAEQIAANQLQIDSSLEALNRIAQTTTFQGRRLLDGSLDFNITGGANFSTVSDLQIDQANLGATGSVAVDVNITAAATQAQLTNSAGFSTAAQATATLKFNDEVTTAAAASGAVITIQATDTSIENATIEVLQVAGLGAGSETASYNSVTNILTLTVDDTDATTAANIVDAINNQVTEFKASVDVAGAITAAETLTLIDGEVTDADSLAFTAASAGAAFNDVAISIVSDPGTPAGTPTAVYDADAHTLVLTVNNTADTTLANLVTAIATDGTFTAVATSNGDGSLNVASGNVADLDATANTEDTGGEVLNANVDLQISGSTGAEVFSFEAGTTRAQIAAAINLVSDSTSITATESGSSLVLDSSDYGSAAFVDVSIIEEGTGGTFGGGFAVTRDDGTNVAATVNGVTANASGNTLSINTSTLDLKATVDAGSSTDFSFTITGGGALFQLGPDVVSNQQARIGIISVNTARLGGVNGKLYRLASGGTADLTTDPTTAARIVDDAINQITSLRGRLGAFQRTLLETNKNALSDTLVNLTEAESQIRDADFAAETAALTRAQ
ncbi:MAG: flagellin, partial [Pirellulales bacterium]